MDKYRFLVDDASFRVSEVPSADVEAALDRLSDQLQECRDRSEVVGVISSFDLIECRPELLLYELLTGNEVARDSRVRAYSLLDKCGRFDSDPEFVVDPAVDVNGIPVESFAFATVLMSFHGRRAVGVLALIPVCAPGRTTLKDVGGEGYGFVVVDEATRVAFYRSIFMTEDAPEERFFVLALQAFPRLRFSDSLTFRRFDGTYADLRDPVVEHLGALNDRFRDAFLECNGLSGEIAASVGVDLSIEGSTRRSEQLMKKRDVEYRGKTYRCEWHTKLEPHRNRIHIHPGDTETNECVLIGMFVDHLPT